MANCTETFTTRHRLYTYRTDLKLERFSVAKWRFVVDINWAYSKNGADFAYAIKIWLSYDKGMRCQIATETCHWSALVLRAAKYSSGGNFWTLYLQNKLSQIPFIHNLFNVYSSFIYNTLSNQRSSVLHPYRRYSCILWQWLPTVALTSLIEYSLILIPL